MQAHDTGVGHRRHFIAAIIGNLGLLIACFNAHSTPRPIISTMGMTTRSLITKNKPTSKITVATAATPKER
jgi:hypothetical protein